MAAEANEASTVTPRSEAEGPPSKEALSPTPPGLTDLPQKVTQPDLPPPNWHREKPRKSSRVLKELGLPETLPWPQVVGQAVHVVIALVYLFIGGYLVAAVQNLHLVVQKCWYPFWGAASFLISGILAITMESFQKNYLMCLIANSISFICVLAGLFVIAKDLFLETPFEFPIWKPYPNDTVHIQRLVLALLCVTCVEVFLPGLMAVMAYKDARLSAEEDDLSLVPDSPLELKEQSVMPPPSYEDVTQGDLQDEQERSFGRLKFALGQKMKY
ncbi:membrane-spanning 4-domains subfamily A member 10 isoform 2-T4 [Dama dama]|uniref:membrane-spanning 4-domains subfamily A member 10 isoform X2 n=1 Tax=Dama dama TaxID=30532 RepID=UPI002A36EDAC|nr:membrane-spanning 4-domains subfamily A member 10 isoform X2 [Dama dama]